jgi:signal transduction histidine kinase
MAPLSQVARWESAYINLRAAAYRASPILNLPMATMQAHDHDAVTANFLPHGFCYLWHPGLLWTHVVSDFLIGAAYVTIAFSLAWLVHRVRRDIPFSWAFVAFGLFIVSCGLTHFMEIWTLWEPRYWLSGGLKAVTAAVSVATAIAMPFTVPRAVATVRDARLSRERELAAVRAETLEGQNAVLRAQAAELEQQRQEAQALAAELATANEALQGALQDARHAHEQAERASGAKTVFLRTMSHELRTPLNAVIGYTQLMEIGAAGPVTAEQRGYLNRIDRSAAHLLSLIDEVLTLSRDLSEGREPELKTISLRKLVDEVAIMTAPQAMQQEIRFEVGEIPNVIITTDAKWLKQILLNLTSNAVKFTPRGSVQLAARVADDVLFLSVTDTGIGIAEEHLDDIFQPFWQADQGTTRMHGGSGLGLSVSQELAQRLGGEISVSTRRGEGSTFTLRIPLQQ